MNKQDLNKVIDKFMEEPKLVGKIQTLMDCNIHFNIFQDNIFWLKAEKNLTFKNVVFCSEESVNSKGVQKVTGNIAKQLLTVCSVMNEKPYI